MRLRSLRLGGFARMIDRPRAKTQMNNRYALIELAVSCHSDQLQCNSTAVPPTSGLRPHNAAYNVLPAGGLRLMASPFVCTGSAGRRLGIRDGTGR